MWVQGWKRQAGSPTHRNFLSSDANDIGSVADGSRLNSSVTLFPGFTKPFLFKFLQDSKLHPDCPAQLSLFLVVKKCVLVFS